LSPLTPSDFREVRFQFDRSLRIESSAWHLLTEGAESEEASPLWYDGRIMFPGLGGILAVVGIASGVHIVVYEKSKEYPAFTFEPQGKPGSFEPHIARYLRLAEFIIGLASGSIVLLVGSSVFKGNSGHLPWYYASPLLLLGACVLFGIVFMLWIQFWYERFQHGVPYHRGAYSITKTLGFCSALYFCFGYIWLVWVVTRVD
jgi:hypothetical protein